MKNPFMSAWLSAANKAAGPIRGAWGAAAKRGQTAMIKEAGKAMGLGATSGKPRTSRRKTKP